MRKLFKSYCLFGANKPLTTYDIRNERPLASQRAADEELGRTLAAAPAAGLNFGGWIFQAEAWSLFKETNLGRPSWCGKLRPLSCSSRYSSRCSRTGPPQAGLAGSRDWQGWKRVCEVLGGACGGPRGRGGSVR
ncbi:hypothetical protein ACRRTK_012607 [Alexandromys fortis]